MPRHRSGTGRSWTGPLLARQLRAVREHADRLGIVAVIGAADPIPGKRPHNSLYALPGPARYDKRYLSNTEISDWYTPGFDEVCLRHQGWSFGMTICIEVQFPELFAGYEQAGVDGVLHATYGMGAVGDVILQAHAGHQLPVDRRRDPAANADNPASGIVGPRWKVAGAAAVRAWTWRSRCWTAPSRCSTSRSTRRGPWRRLARQGRIYGVNS